MWYIVQLVSYIIAWVQRINAKWLSGCHQWLLGPSRISEWPKPDTIRYYRVSGYLEWLIGWRGRHPKSLISPMISVHAILCKQYRTVPCDTQNIHSSTKFASWQAAATASSCMPHRAPVTAPPTSWWWCTASWSSTKEVQNRYSLYEFRIHTELVIIESQVSLHRVVMINSLSLQNSSGSSASPCCQWPFYNRLPMGATNS